jgi:hypothetical protein
VHPAPLASHKQWVPAVENHGEGVFFSLDGDHVREWAALPAVRERARNSSDEASTAGSPSAARRAPTSSGCPFVLLHSLSHLLITAVALECGYPSSSIRERVYAPRRPLRRIALHRLARRRGHPRGPRRHGARAGAPPRQDALELGRLCSNDPVCAHHDPDNASGELTLQGAACHGCLLISETSCERQNTWLDRALVVPTLTHRDTAFFRDW